MINEGTKTITKILQHIKLVEIYLNLVADNLCLRGLMHDLSKWDTSEFEGFVEINQVARRHKFGSPEYKASIKTDVVSLHYAANSHHPEHHESGINDMSLIDIIEMVIDWKAASEVYGNTSLEESLDIQQERYNLTSEQMYLIKLIVKELE